jgi:signal transduction histidine kinase
VLTGLLAASLLITAETLLAYPLRHASPPESLGPLYLLGVVVIAAGWGLRAGAATAVASAIAFDYFHFPPIGNIGIYYSGKWLAIPIYLVVALVVGSVADLARTRAVEAAKRRRDAELAADHAHRLADELAALTRVATLTAHGAAAPEVFAAVSGEVGNLLDSRYTALGRFEPDVTVTVVGTWRRDADPAGMPAVDSRWPIAAGSLAERVWRTAQPVRLDRPGDAVETAPFPQGPEIASAVACPIVVEGRVWGVMISGFSAPGPRPEGTEARMTKFSRLLATAIADAESRTQLIDARARVVAAVDDTRRRIERDLHDGVQQNLYALALQLTAARDARQEPSTLRTQLAEMDDRLGSLVTDLREISRGLRPALLSQGGLDVAVGALARRCGLPVELDVHAGRRLPAEVEAAAYYIVSEALTNAARHSHATTVRVRLDVGEEGLRLAVRDDGIGGANPEAGSGLAGLRDRVEALGGRMEITSPVGRGTDLLATVPARTDPSAGPGRGV